MTCHVTCRSRERAAVPRRRSDNDDDNLPTPSRSTSVRRGRMSDYMLRDGTDDYLNFGGISAAHSETDVSRSRKTSQAGLHVSLTLSRGRDFWSHKPLLKFLNTFL